MKQTGKVALGGVLGSLSLTFMLLTFFSVGTYALPAIAGAVFIPFVIEISPRSAWMVYASVAILSLFISPDLEAKILFLSFFGYYPIIKAQLERIKKGPLEWIIKLAIFNAAIVISYYLMLNIFGLNIESFTIFGFNMIYIMFFVGNLIFVLYDFALSNLVLMYMKVLHKRVARVFHLDK